MNVWLISHALLRTYTPIQKLQPELYISIKKIIYNRMIGIVLFKIAGARVEAHSYE